MKVEYTGQMSSTAGFTACVANMPFRAVYGGTGTNNMLTVTDIFNFAADRHRLDLDARELVWRPTDGDSLYRSPGNAAGEGSNEDFLLSTGTPASTQTTSVTPFPGNVHGMCFAYTGAAANGTISITITKVVECRLAPHSGIIETIPRVVARPKQGQMIQSIVEMLDKRFPNWQNHLVAMASSAVTHVSRLALAGSA